MSTNKPNNAFLFYGEDDFSIRRKIEHWKREFAKKYSANAITVLDTDGMAELDLIKKLRDELAPSLFSSKKLLVIRNVLPKKADSPLVEFLHEFVPQIPKDFFVIFWQTQKPDARLGFVKKFLNLVAVTEFELPQGLKLNQWIVAMGKTLGVTISAAAADRLAQFLGRDLFEEKKVGGRIVSRREAYDLWQVHSEILKLSSKSSTIEPSDVTELVRPKIPDSIFALTDKIIAQNQSGAFQAFENFLSNQTLDEKSAFIKIIALLAEQMRSLLVVFLLTKRGLNNDQIAEKLGWSSGRVFVTSKNLSNISQDKIKSLLLELQKIDLRLKSVDANSKLDIDLFLVEATS